MKNMTARLREAEEKFTHKCKEFAESAGVTPEPITTRRPTPAEALELQIKLPWHGKVQVMTPADLTIDLFEKLEEYGVFRSDITNLFGFKHQPAFYEWLRKNDIQIARKVGPRPKKGNQGRNKEHEIDHAIRTEKDLDAKLDMIDKRISDMGCKTGENYSQTPAEIIPDKPGISTPSTKELPISMNQQKIDTPAVISSIAEDADGLNYQDRHNLEIHAPTDAEKEDLFRPKDDQPIPFVPALTLRDCAEKLVAAINARDAADKQIEYYTNEIRRLA